MVTSGSGVRVVGRYALHHEIASGGMASIFLGKMCGPVGFSPIVAIKSLHPQYAKDPEFVRMFLDEARLAGRIRHPNIVPVIDVHAEGEDLFLVLEYVHGESLARLVRSGRREGALVSKSVTMAVVRDVLYGLHAAHEAKDERGEPLGLVHRDVSPQNILVGADGVARVLDFGIAKATGRVTSTRDGQVKGKFAYMAPEQLRGETVDRRADVYSAAVVLWEALTSERLFGGENEGHTVERVLFGAVTPPSALRPDIPTALDAVVMRGLSREPAGRFGTAKEMAIALSLAVPPATTSEIGEWVEARALDALERRARLVGEVEASIQGSAVATAVEPDTAAPAALAAPRRGRGRVAIVVAAAAMVLLVGLGLRVSETRGPALTPAARADPAENAGSSPALPPAVPPAASEPEPEPSASPVSARVSSPPVTTARPVSETKSARPLASPPMRSVTHAAKAGATTSKAACQRRGEGGEIEFDMDCLRASQHAP
jgi:hypothetical protein